MSHQIDWANERGLRCIEQHIGPRHRAQMPIIGPIIFGLMESIGQFQLKVIERELHSRGWVMKTHSLTVRDIKSVIWFINASDQSGYWCEQKRFTTSKGNVFSWRVMNCGIMQKELNWRAEAKHAAASIPHTTYKSQLFEATIEPITNDQFSVEPPAQSISLEGLDVKE